MNPFKKLFIIGLVVHIVYVLIVCSTGSSLSDFLQKDDDQLMRIVSLDYSLDTVGYIASADNFLAYGVFGKENEPDHLRTIGYPLIIYLFKATLGAYWYYGLLIFQILLGALIYPIAYGIGTAIFPKSKKRTIFYSIITLMLLGGYFTKSMYVLTDMPCASFLLLGMYLSIISITTKKNYLMILSVIALSFAALIRPNLILYPIVHFLLLLYVAKEHNLWIQIKTKRVIWASSVILLLMCNLSSFRLYNAYGVFSPSSVLGINMFEYSVKEIMSRNGEEEKYVLWESEIDAENNWITQDKLRKDRFFEVVFNNPRLAILYWVRVATKHLLSPHHKEIVRTYMGDEQYMVLKNHKVSKATMRSSFTVMWVGYYILYFLNAIILLLGFLYLCYKFSKKEYLFVFVFLSLIFLIIGPSFIVEGSGSRMRLPVEPFLLILAFQYLEIKKKAIKNILRLATTKKS
ncbi:MAG: hypothetical protein OXH57_05905 [Ekhidna sp.]|nr:hypothetical protein [Ekhidna sp.]